MQLSWFVLGLLILAAGGDTKPIEGIQKSKRETCPKNKKSDITPVTNSVVTASPTASDVAPTDSSAGGITPIGNETYVPGTGSGGVGGGGGSCPGFRSVVFNGGASTMSGWPGKTWASLSGSGVDDWIGFTLVNPESSTPDLNEHQIHLVMDPRNVDQAVELLKTNPPKYLGLFNEPDFSFQDSTPKTDPVTAASALQPILSAAHPQTTFLSPALAEANSDWLATFRDHCNNCFDQIPIISQHIYSPDTNYVMGQITQLHATWPDKKIWITELGPATQGCTLDNDGMIQWMNTLLPQIMQLGYVEKVFWNCGEHGAGMDGTPNGPCNPSLTNDDGSPTPLLTAYSKLCGGGGSGDTVATS